STMLVNWTAARISRTTRSWPSGFARPGTGGPESATMSVMAPSSPGAFLRPSRRLADVGGTSVLSFRTRPTSVKTTAARRLAGAHDDEPAGRTPPDGDLARLPHPLRDGR